MFWAKDVWITKHKINSTALKLDTKTQPPVEANFALYCTSTHTHAHGHTVINDTES